MILDLIAHQRLVGGLHRLVQQLDGEVGNAELFHVTGLFHFRHRAQGLGQRDAIVRPVDEQKIDLVDAQLAQALLHGPLDVLRCHAGMRDLGRHHHVGTLARFAYALAHFSFIGIGLCRIDMAIAEMDRLLDEASAVSAVQFPSAESDRPGS